MSETETEEDGLTRLAPGKWRARITWYENKVKCDTQRRINVSTEGGIRKERVRAAVERERIRKELTGKGEEWTVSEAFAAWLPTLGESTRRQRKTHAARFEKLFGKKKLSDVEAPDIQQWLEKLACQDHTAALHRATLVGLYKFATGKGKLRGQNPVKQTVARKTPETEAEALARCEGSKKEPSKALMGDDRWRFFEGLREMEPDIYPIMRTQLIIGGRVGEAASLQLTDIDWDTGRVDVCRNALRKGKMGPPKNRKRREAWLGTEGLEFLRGHVARMEQEKWPGWDVWLFPRPTVGKRGYRLTKRRRYDTWPLGTIELKVRQVMDALGIECARATHAMRHTHVTIDQALRADAIGRQTQGEDLKDLQARVGHASAKMTETYTDEAVRRERQRASFQRLAPHMAGVFAPGVTPIRPVAPGGVNGGVVITETPENQARE